jgi:hypothetical protein
VKKKLPLFHVNTNVLHDNTIWQTCKHIARQLASMQHSSTRHAAAHLCSLRLWPMLLQAYARTSLSMQDLAILAKFGRRTELHLKLESPYAITAIVLLNSRLLVRLMARHAMREGQPQPLICGGRAHPASKVNVRMWSSSLKLNPHPNTNKEGFVPSYSYSSPHPNTC